MEKRKFDLKSHASEKGSTWYLIKLIFYIVCIIVLSVIMYFQYRTSRTDKIPANTEIEGATVELSDQSNL